MNAKNNSFFEDLPTQRAWERALNEKAGKGIKGNIVGKDTEIRENNDGL